MEVFFPDRSASADLKDYYNHLNKHTRLLLQKIQGVENKGEIEKVEDYLLGFEDPKPMGGKDGLETKTIKGFDQISQIVNKSKYLNDPKTASTRDLYEALDLIKADADAIKKAKK